jgi:hypothetical protein
MSIDWKLLAEARGDAIVKLEKRLADAALVEAELREVLQDLADTYADHGGPKYEGAYTRAIAAMPPTPHKK